MPSWIFGFEDKTILSCHCEACYNPVKEMGVHPLDDLLSIDWKANTSQAMISQKDQAGHTWSAFIPGQENKNMITLDLAKTGSSSFHFNKKNLYLISSHVIPKS